MKNKIIEWNRQFRDASIDQFLSYFLNKYDDRYVVASSLSYEDQINTHVSLKIRPNARIFILDTGRLHKETYDVIDQTSLLYDFKYEILKPNERDVSNMVNKFGLNLFYDSIDNRKKCCSVRKVEPLSRVLSTADVWVTGLRSQQSVTRTSLELVQWDDTFNLLKLNPLANWTEDEVKEFVRINKIPFNKLHEKGYPSIGCEPCTRAIKDDEDIRSGRWWWEDPEHKECGLHVVNGKLQSKKITNNNAKGNLND